MNLDEDDLIAVLTKELGRQHEEHSNGPYTYNENGDEIGVDGYLRLRELARAIIKANDDAVRLDDLSRFRAKP